MADKDELGRLLQPESARLERKLSGDPDAIVRALVAFANDYAEVGGGEVVCGVKQPEHGDDLPGIAVGLDDKTRNELSRKVQEKCQREVRPPISPALRTCRLPDSTRQLLVFAQAATGQVHTFRHRYIIRAHDQNVEPQPPQLEELIRRRATVGFLEQPCPGATVDDLDPLVMREFLGHLSNGGSWERLLEPDHAFKEDARSLVVEERLPDGRRRLVPRRFAILLFGRARLRRAAFPGATVSITSFATTNPDDRFHGLAPLGGPLVMQARELLARLEVEAGLQVDKTQSPLGGRPNWPRYSALALREAAINALVHRDYEDGNPVHVAVFPERIEISSPGGYVAGLDPASVRRGQARAWRNVSLAAFMEELKFAQQRGTGIRRIIDETRRIAGRDPTFHDDARSVRVVIPAYVPEPPRIASSAAGDVLVLVSVGYPSVRAQVQGSVADLGLAEAPVVLDYALEGYLATPAEWEARATALRDRLRPLFDAPEARHVHMFYRGPVALAALVGALVPPVKVFTMYHFGERGYERAFTIDRRFRADRRREG